MTIEAAAMISYRRSVGNTVSENPRHTGGAERSVEPQRKPVASGVVLAKRQRACAHVFVFVACFHGAL